MSRVFVRELWLPKSDQRLAQFDNLLAQESPIGMVASELIELLGPPDFDGTVSKPPEPEVFGYTLAGFGFFCGNAYTSVEFKEESGRIRAWRIISDMTPKQWVTATDIRTVAQADALPAEIDLGQLYRNLRRK